MLLYVWYWHFDVWCLNYIWVQDVKTFGSYLNSLCFQATKWIRSCFDHLANLLELYDGSVKCYIVFNQTGFIVNVHRDLIRMLGQIRPNSTVSLEVAELLAGHRIMGSRCRQVADHLELDWSYFMTFRPPVSVSVFDRLGGWACRACGRTLQPYRPDYHYWFICIE